MILVLYNIILITNFKLIEMCIKSSSIGEGVGGVRHIGIVLQSFSNELFVTNLLFYHFH